MQFVICVLYAPSIYGDAEPAKRAHVERCQEMRPKVQLDCRAQKKGKSPTGAESLKLL